MSNLPEDTIQPQPETTPPLPTEPLSSPLSTQPPPLQKSKLPRWLIVAGILTVLVLTFSFGLWWFYRNLNQNQPVSPQETDRPFIYTESQQSTDRNWSQYTSQKCKYQISYPSAWYIYTDAEQEDLATVLITSGTVQSETVSINEARIQIGCSPFDSSLAPKIVVDDLNARYQGEGFSISPIQQTTIGGKIAYYQTVSSNQTVSLKEYYIFPTNNHVVIINIVPLNSSQIDIAETVLKKIIFLD